MANIAFERTIDDVSTLKALADPIRLMLLELTMGEPERTWTARELAAHANVLPTNIYYHINMLERHELLQVRDTRVVNGIIEKHYGAGQRSLSFQRRPDDSGDGFRIIVGRHLNKVRDEIDAGLASGAMSANQDADDAERMMLTLAQVYIPPGKVAAFRRDMLRLVQRYEGGNEDDCRFTVMGVIYPS